MHLFRSTVLFLILIPVLLKAQQTSVIRGVIKDHNGIAVEMTQVILKELKQNTLTDNKGSYSFTNVPYGNYTLIFMLVGYKTQEKKITVKTTETSVNISLAQDEKQLQEVEVNGKSKTQELKEEPFTVNAIDVKPYANSTTDANQVLNRSTGIKVREEGGLGSNFNFSINGLSGRAIRFFIDGIPMESFGSSLTLNNIPVNLIDRIEVFKGVVPVSLGTDALGGAVNVVTNQKVKRFLDASYSYGSFNTHRASLSGAYTHEKTGFTIRASGFYNSSDNNYMMKQVEVIDGNRFVTKNLPRFHDQYLSAMGQVETGFTNRKWADALLIGMLYSHQYKQTQTGVNQETVIGGVDTKGNYIMPTLKYSKQNLFIKGLSANLFGTYAKNNYVVTDTSSNTYGWDGKPITTNNTGGEINYQKSRYNYTNTFTMVRGNLAYEIDSVHSFNLNYVLNDAQRTGYNELNLQDPTNVFDKPNKLNKRILGAGYQLNLFKQRFTTTILGKYYDFSALARNSVYYSSTTGVTTIESDKHYHFYGYGAASRFKITKTLGLKASYEHAYRLPEPDEIFGDGRFVISNINLKPEESDNVNAGGYFFKQIKKHFISFEASYFFRNVKDFIYFVPGVKFAAYLNEGSVQVNGFDAEIKYAYRDFFSFSVNGSYQNAVNNSEYITGTTQKDVTYLDRIPNQPYLFGNVDIGIGKSNLLGKGTRIQFNWFTQYVEQYYLTWASLGSLNSKNIIPQQLIHNAVLSYSLKEGRYNISFEVRNLTDVLAYDNFKLQKPGRSFFVKLRYFIK